MKGKITVLFGLMLMLAGLLWYAATLQESAYAAQTAQEIVPQLQQIASPATVQETEPAPDGKPEEKMNEIFIDGIGYIGVLNITSLALELPVISSWSAENGKLAPCRYAGYVFQDNMILCAHNYSSHFGKLTRLKSGDRVVFTDVDGKEYTYQAAEFQTLGGTDVEMIRDGDWDLTLFTCTSGGKMRYSVRCNRIS